ncbi:hypothetical protein BDV96DRAFT_263217 [Lophiotrema nucula]|uniref:BZIP domain-containing protein n=1 Tax=Lophiotrema nucula TaxID=690887 RepID=A0A6A5YML3_9PLEO|nr:hypothetical protein BDV96DRAFT_263217 [Lophiotrema nucula]
MTRKAQDTPSSIRIRENQQRSRARRKDLIESLQKRVHHYELNGVKATQEVQHAARRVVRENEQLRSLLALRGVSREEVDSYLRSLNHSNPVNDSHAASVKTNVLGRVNPPGTPAGLSSNAVSSTEDLLTNGTNSSLCPTKVLEHDEQAVLGERQYVNQPCDCLRLRDPSEDRPECALRHDHDPTASTPVPVNHEEVQGRKELQDFDRTGLQIHEIAVPEKDDLCPNDPDCFCPSALVVEGESPSPGLETSCEIAARIIIDMGGSRDRDLVRASLGCSSRDDCSVKNTTVLQVMGEM